MNIAKARQIALERVLKYMQAEQDLTRGNTSEIWFKSPLRPEESTASLKVDISKNLWYDHGSGQGGDIIKLVQDYLGGKSVSEALQWLKTTEGRLPQQKIKQTLPASKKPQQSTSERGLLLVKEKNITNPALLAYAANRRISGDVLHRYCREIYFRGKTEKTLFGIGFANDSGGYEVRGAIGNFKAFVGDHKDITTLYGSDSNPDTLHVFEGYWDLLSKETFNPMTKKEASISLNSGNLMEKGIQKILSDPRLQEVQFVRLWLQNDDIGKKTLHRFCEALETDYSVGDMSEHYAGCKDLNQSLIENPSQWKPAGIKKVFDDTAWQRKPPKP